MKYRTKGVGAEGIITNNQKNIVKNPDTVEQIWETWEKGKHIGKSSAAEKWHISMGLTWMC